MKIELRELYVSNGSSVKAIKLNGEEEIFSIDNHPVLSHFYGSVEEGQNSMGFYYDLAKRLVGQVTSESSKEITISPHIYIDEYISITIQKDDLVGDTCVVKG